MYIGSRKNNGTLFVILLVAGFSLIAVYLNEGENGKIHGLQKGALSILADTQQIIYTAIDPVRNLWSTVSNLTKLTKENAELKREVSRLKKERLAKEQTREENARLRELLDFRKVIAYESIPANVIGVGMRHATIILDKGKQDDLSENMPVLLNSGLVGKLLKVVDGASLTQLLTDPKSAVGAKIKENGTVGIVEGEIGGKLMLKFIDSDAEIKLEQTVVTSGLGGIFPKDIPIGKIVNIGKDRATLEVVAEVKPFVNYSKLDQVFIITNPPEKISETFTGI